MGTKALLNASSSRAKTALVGALVGALFAGGVVFALWAETSSPPELVVRPLGLSLRVGVRMPPTQALTAPKAQALFRVGDRARREIRACLEGTTGWPEEVELVFDAGVVSFARGPLLPQTDAGTCVANVVEGLWGELDGQHRLVLNLALP